MIILQKYFPGIQINQAQDGKLNEINLNFIVKKYKRRFSFIRGNGTTKY